MNDALLMRSFKSFGDLFRNRESFVYRDSTLADPVSQSRPFYQLEHQRLLPLSFFQPVDMPDVGMVQ